MIYVCANCSADFERRASRVPDYGVFCRAEPCRRAWNATRMRVFNSQKKAELGEPYYRRYRPKQNADECACGTPLLHGWRCRPCGELARAAERASKARRRRAERKLEAASRGTVGRGTWYVGTCDGCGSGMTTRRPRARFCGRKCLRRSVKSDRRARAKGCTVTPGRRWAVFERDQWTCQICGLAIDPEARYPDLASATIDHVIPLARGGPHEQGNWQAAHSYCNSVKRDTDLRIDSTNSQLSDSMSV